MLEQREKMLIEAPVATGVREKFVIEAPRAPAGLIEGGEAGKRGREIATMRKGKRSLRRLKR